MPTPKHSARSIETNPPIGSSGSPHDKRNKGWLDLVEEPIQPEEAVFVQLDRKGLCKIGRMRTSGGFKMRHALLIVGTSANGKTFGLNHPRLLGLGAFSPWRLLLHLRSRGLLPPSPRFIARLRESKFQKVLRGERPCPFFALLDWDLGGHQGHYLLENKAASSLQEQISDYPSRLNRFLNRELVRQMLGRFNSVQVIIVKERRNQVSDLYWWREGPHPDSGHTGRCWLYPEKCEPQLIDAADQVYDLLYERLSTYLETIRADLAQNGTRLKILSSAGNNPSLKKSQAKATRLRRRRLSRRPK